MNSRTIFKAAMMMVGLILCGLASGLLVAFIASRLMEEGSGGWGDLVGAIFGMAAGYPLGVIIGMAITRFVVRYPGSLLLGIPGSLIAPVIVFILADRDKQPGRYLWLYVYRITAERHSSLSYQRI